ncbi:MAG TPA: 2-phosphosulfolactate phosphatase [Candidatus Acidoferrales bacterium]|jgi:2-phosphosulfolactate phosphatase|nr:2-phosphosulfolactate phosphatase [Candidatus Acidoferrales bacterium]
MKIEVILTPAELPALAEGDLGGTACVVFDVLRATSTIVTALANGASAIIPVSEISEAMDIGKKRPEVLLGGERNGVKIRTAEGEFDFGNSPREYTPEKVQGKTIVSTTTNGTRALRACAHAKMVLAGSFLNLGATAKFLREQNFENILLVCAGTRENTALEDVLAAGALGEILGAAELSDAAQIALAVFGRAKGDLSGAVSKSENAMRLLAIPDLREDVEFCLQQDVFDFAAVREGDAIKILKR